MSSNCGLAARPQGWVPRLTSKMIGQAQKLINLALKIAIGNQLNVEDQDGKRIRI